MGRLNIAMNGGQMPQKNMRPRISPYSRQPVDLQKAVQKCLRIPDQRQWYGLQHFLRRQPKGAQALFSSTCCLRTSLLAAR